MGILLHPWRWYRNLGKLPLRKWFKRNCSCLPPQKRIFRILQPRRPRRWRKWILTRIHKNPQRWRILNEKMDLSLTFLRFCKCPYPILQTLSIRNSYRRYLWNQTYPLYIYSSFIRYWGRNSLLDYLE